MILLTKRLYCKGARVVNIAELSQYNGFLYIRDKIWHPAWWQNLQFHLLVRYIKENIVYYADKIGGLNENRKEK